MSSRATESASETDVAVAPERRSAGASPAGLGRLGPNDVLRLQRTAGNRAVGRIAAVAQRRSLQRASPEERPMLGPAEGGKTDELLDFGNVGTKFQWDYFDRTLMIYTAKDGPGGGKAYQLVYNDGSPEELATRKPEELIQSAEELSPLRAESMEYLRTSQGKFQETEGERETRVANAGTGRPTLCYQHTGAIATVLSDGTEKGMGGMDPRKGAMKGLRAGAFHTLESHPNGPRPGDIVSYGAVLPPAKGKTLRQANFFTVLHIGIFKSRRKTGEGEIWTVVDGGQGKFEGRQETRERTRTFTRERLEVALPTKFFESGKNKGTPSGWETEEIDCGVLKSKKADAGQSADDKLLRGWLDIDEYFGGGSAPTDLSGVNNRVFVGKAKASAKP